MQEYTKSCIYVKVKSLEPFAPPRPPHYNCPMLPRPLLLALALAACAPKDADWPVYGGNTNNTHYTTLDQISPANVSQLEVVWTYDTGDAFEGSEMQANPIVVDGVLYATTPKLHVFALNAATGEPLWRFDPNNGQPPT
jgi:quinoprotein glucose dehydrogenase